MQAIHLLTPVDVGGRHLAPGPAELPEAVASKLLAHGYARAIPPAAPAEAAVVPPAIETAVATPQPRARRRAGLS
jgi:hypothetical protein